MMFVYLLFLVSCLGSVVPHNSNNNDEKVFSVTEKLVRFINEHDVAHAHVGVG